MFTCPHCGYDGSSPARFGPEPFTYVELVPRRQRVEARAGRLFVSCEAAYGDEGEQSALLCNACEEIIDAVPELIFECAEECS
jgi:hypothetical protein